MKMIMLLDIMDPQGYITLSKDSTIGRNCIMIATSTYDLVLIASRLL